MATVWHARVPWRRDVAIKFLRREHYGQADLVRRFFHEDGVLHALRNTGVTPLPRGASGNFACPWYAMDYLGGMLRLRDAVGGAQQKSLPLFWALRVGGAICAGVEALHRAGIVHRDLSPDNIMYAVGRGGKIVLRLIDFDLAKPMPHRCGPASRLPNLTGGGWALGKGNYAAPEQWREIDSADERSDAYSVGIILWECLTGETPFGGDGIGIDKIRKRHESAPRDSTRLTARGVSRELAELITRLIHADPNARPSLDEVRVALLLNAERGTAS
jgi:serine/threonine-protein kinase